MSKYKSVNISKELTYIGIDESTLGVGNGSIIMVAAVTNDKNLTIIRPYENALDKAKNFYDNKIPFPTVTSMMEEGMSTYYWMRVNKGRFKRQQIAHAGIGQLVKTNGFKPESTVLYVDAFHNPIHMSRYLIKEYLSMHDFHIPEQNIEIIQGGDKSVKIINFADLLAFQIGHARDEEFKKYNPEAVRLEIKAKKIEFNSQRIEPISQQGRQYLEELLNSP